MPPESLRVAAAQYAPVLADRQANIALARRWMGEAAAAGAELLVLPECSTTGYLFEDRLALSELAESVPGPTTEHWRDQSAGHGLYLVAGLVERSGDHLFNTAVVITPEGGLYRYRKIHLWGIERNLYQEGHQPVVVPLPWGNLGVLICYDLWFPELPRTLALAGADLLAVPSNWGGNPRMRSPFDAFGLPVGHHMAVSAACASECPVVVADRVGTEGPLCFLGNSSIVSATGEVLAGPLGDTVEGLLVADISLGRLNHAPGQGHLESRRPQAYASHVHDGRPVA